MERQVFISHSSKDHQFAMKLVEALEESGVYCWIAPRDIPYGHMWSEKIVEGIEASKILLFIFSEDANQSQQVIRELCLALEKGLLVIPIRLKEIPYNKSLEYYLSTVQWAQIPPTKGSLSEWITTFSQKIKTYLQTGQKEELLETVSNDSADMDILETEDVEYHEFGDLDDELKENFSRLFDKEHPCEEEPVSPLKEKLLKRICDRYNQDIWSQPDDEEEITASEDSQDQEADRDDLFFSLRDKDSFTFVFIIQKSISLPDHSLCMKCYPCPREEEVLEDGTIEATFTLPADAVDWRDGNPLVILSMLEQHRVYMINLGFVDPELRMMKISKEPKPMELKFTSSNSESGIIRVPFRRDSKFLLIDPITKAVITSRYIHDRKKWKERMVHRLKT